MGKASRRKNKVVQPLHQTNHHYRTVITFSIITALAGGSWYFYSDYTSPKPSLVRSTNINFSFLGYNQDTIDKKAQEAAKYPLASSQEGTAGLNPVDYLIYNGIATSAEINQYLEAFRNTARQAGFECREVKIGSAVRTGVRIIPETTYNKDVKQYLTFAMNFLRRHPGFKDLHTPEVEWIDYGSQKYNRSAIAGYVALTRVSELDMPLECTLPDGRKEPGRAIKHEPHYGSQAYLMKLHVEENRVRIKKNKEPYLFVGTAGGVVGVLQAPFSEILPVMLFSGIERYVEQEEQLSDSRNAMDVLNDVGTLTEAISESLSLYLVEEILKENEMEDALRFVSLDEVKNHRFALAKKEPKYSLVPAAYELLQKWGIKETIGSFMNDPHEYMAALHALQH